jgi:hypothetical protein
LAKKDKTNVVVTVTLKPFDLKTEDDLLADAFLWGWINPTIGMRSRSYFAEGGTLDRKARHALIRVLRSDRPLSPTLRKHLAELFEVDSTVTGRRLLLAFRLNRRHSNPMGKQDIANFYKRMCKELAGQKNCRGLAVSLTADHFGMATGTIYKSSV